jgi:glycosyltransferase involved in cell wall biosynthesis
VEQIAVSFVASTFTVGGSERVLSHLITRLPRDRFHVKLYFLRDAGKLGRMLFSDGVEGVQHLQHHRFDPSVAVRLYRYLRKDTPDILFLLDHHNAMLWGRIAGMMARVPHTVVASHATGLFGGRRNFRVTDRWLMEFTARVVALSRAHARYLAGTEGVAPGKITVIENGIPVEEYAGGDSEDPLFVRREIGVDPDDRIITMIAALRPEKAHEVFLRAARLLVVSHSGVKFLIVGDGSRREELEAMASDLGLDDVVRFLGVRRDVARILHISDVLALPSHPVVETLPMTVLEAMAAGVPVVATRVGSVPDLIENGRTGLLIDPGDPDALARAMGALIDAPERARTMADEAKRLVVDRYSVETMVGNYAALFESLATS